MFIRLFFVLAIAAIGHFPILSVAEPPAAESFFFNHLLPTNSLDLNLIKNEFTLEIKVKHSMLPEGECTRLEIYYRSFLNAGNHFARPQFNVNKMEKAMCSEFQNKNDETNWNGIKIDLCKKESKLTILLQHPFAEKSVSENIVVNENNEPNFKIQFWSQDSPYSKIIYPNGANWTDKPDKILTLFNGKQSMGEMKGFWAVGIDMYAPIVNKSSDGKLPLLLAQQSKNKNKKELPLELTSPQIKNIWDEKLVDRCTDKMKSSTPSPSSENNSGESSPNPKFQSSTIFPITTTTECAVKVENGMNLCKILGDIDEYVKCGLVIDKDSKGICGTWPYLFEKKIYGPKRVVIEGKPKAENPKQFQINFLCNEHGQHYCDSEEILLQFNTTFDYKGTKNDVTMNSRQGRQGNYQWGFKQRLWGTFPFAAGKHFHMEFNAKKDPLGSDSIVVEIKLDNEILDYYFYLNTKAGKSGPNAPNLGFQRFEIFGDLEEPVTIEFY